MTLDEFSIKMYIPRVFMSGNYFYQLLKIQLKIEVSYQERRE